MSDRASSSDIRGLTSAIRALTLAVSGQSQENPSPAGSESTEGDWSVVGVEEQDIRIASDLNCIQVGQRVAEEGPGPIPPILLPLELSIVPKGLFVLAFGPRLQLIPTRYTSPSTPCLS